MNNEPKLDYEAIAAEMRKEGYGDDITAEYLEALDKRTVAEWEAR
jgi:hypothetical protein